MTVALALGLAAATTGALAGSTRPAHAQQSLIDSDPAVVRARAEVEAAQAAAHEAEAQLEATNEQLVRVQAAITDAQQRIADLDRQRAELAQQRDTLLDHLRQRAVALYSMGGDGAGTAELFSGSALEGARRKQLSDAAARSDRDNARKLEDTRTTLADTQTDLRHQQDALVDQQSQLDALSRKLQAQQAAVDQRVADANAALDRARAIGALHAAGEPIMGPATLTVDQMTAWFSAQGYHPRLNDTSVAELAQIFLEEGGDENVRGDFAFAQAIVETGGFSAAPDNNYSGLGWCDTCTLGTSFPTPRDGIRAQIQLLLNYADADRARRTCTIRPRRTGGPPIPMPPPGSSTRSSPRAGRPRGATWATGIGPPTPTTREGDRDLPLHGRLLRGRLRTPHRANRCSYHR